MALSILDGNQTATTLSTVVSSGQHIPAHTVVSLGATAISNIASAVSGVQVSGTVTANVIGKDINGGLDGHFPLIAYDENIGTSGSQVVPVQVANTSGSIDNNNPLQISGTVTANVFGYDSQNEENLRIGLISYGSGPQVRGAVEVIGADANPLPISGTVTANTSIVKPLHDSPAYGGPVFPVQLISTTDDILGDNMPLAISGTVTVGSCVTHGVTIANSSVTVGGSVSISGTPSVTMGAISGTVTANVASTTVTVSALPSGALTTRFGSVTTANTAQITTAVTNTSRKYLLAQNISAGTVTIGIGFSPTTTQGIQLTAGAGLTFDAFCPTGAVYWLGATTGATWTILEG